MAHVEVGPSIKKLINMGPLQLRYRPFWVRKRLVEVFNIHIQDIMVWYATDLKYLPLSDTWTEQGFLTSLFLKTSMQ